MFNFRADCSKCCGLCCVVPGFLAVQGFRVDKPADTPCPHLNGLHHCAIYATRRVHGYTACEGFDCFGTVNRRPRLTTHRRRTLTRGDGVFGIGFPDFPGLHLMGLAAARSAASAADGSGSVLWF